MTRAHPQNPEIKQKNRTYIHDGVCYREKTVKKQLGCSFLLVIEETLIKVSITNYDDHVRLIAALGAVR